MNEKERISGISSNLKTMYPDEKESNRKKLAKLLIDNEKQTKEFFDENQKKYGIYINIATSLRIAKLYADISDVMTGKGKEAHQTTALHILKTEQEQIKLLKCDNTISDIVKKEIQEMYDNISKEIEILLQKDYEDIKKDIEDSEGECYEILKSIRPDKAIINNSKVANQLLSIDSYSLQEGGIVELGVGKNGNHDVKVTVFSQFDNENIKITGKELTAFDKTVFNAICTLFEAGNQLFTPQMVYRAIHGMTNSERITVERGTLIPIINSIENGIRKRIIINATEQIKKFYQNVSTGNYEGYFLPLEKVTVKNNGQTLECYKFIKMPPLYSYSKNIKQIISVDIKLLDSRNALKNSPEVATIREYLIQRIETEKYRKTKSFNIKYSTIFENVGINTETLNNVQAKRKRDNIKKLLQNHFLELNYIKGHSEYKKGRTFEGVTIEL